MDKSKPEHILVIRLSAMGDVAMTVPLLVGLTKKYPDVKVTVLTKPFFVPIFSGIPRVSVYAADVKGTHKGIRGLWKLYRELITLQIDKVADLHHVLRSSIVKQFFRFHAIPFVQVDKGRAEKKQLTHPNRTSFKALKTTIQRYAEVFEQLGYCLSSLEMEPMPKQILSQELSIFAEHTDKVVLGIAPFAAFEGKMYPLSLMKEVVKQLNNTNKYKIILFGGGKKEVELLDAWEGQFETTLSSAGKFSFAEELRLISNLDLMVAMDSGNAHLAAMFGIPTLTLWGVTHPFAGFYPFGQPKTNALMADRIRYPLIPTSIYGNKYPPGYEKVMETISPQKVVQKLEELLDAPK